MSGIAKTPQPPYYAVIFTSERTDIRSRKCQRWLRYYNIILGISRSYKKMEAERTTFDCSKTRYV